MAWENESGRAYRTDGPEEDGPREDFPEGIRRDLDSLRSRAAIMGGRMEKLHHRLSPVLKLAGPSPVTEEVQSMDAIRTSKSYVGPSALRNQIASITGMLNTVIDQLDQLDERIDL